MVMMMGSLMEYTIEVSLVILMATMLVRVMAYHLVICWALVMVP